MEWAHQCVRDCIYVLLLIFRAPSRRTSIVSQSIQEPENQNTFAVLIFLIVRHFSVWFNLKMWTENWNNYNNNNINAKTNSNGDWRARTWTTKIRAISQCLEMEKNCYAKLPTYIRKKKKFQTAFEVIKIYSFFLFVMCNLFFLHALPPPPSLTLNIFFIRRTRAIRCLLTQSR